MFVVPKTIIMNTRTQRVLNVMHVIAWIVFVGLLIEAGAVMTSYIVSCVNPSAAKHLYKSLDLYPLREISLWYYTIAVSFVIAQAFMKALVAFLLIKVLSSVNLQNPFTIEVARLLEKISVVLVGIAVVAFMNNVEVG
jgi:hypothetical protein